jgi:N-methylhydantoinase B
MFANMAVPSVEVTEAEQPISILSYEFVTDAAGAGKYRGGAPFRRDYRLNATEATLSVRSDRHTFRPFGLYGGSPGAPSQNTMDPDGDCRLLPSKPTMLFRKGEVIRHEHAGGGGWGDPLERDPQAVLRDVRNEFLSAGKADADYGVVIDTDQWSINADATALRRDEIRTARAWSEVPTVQRHDPLTKHVAGK